MRISDWSSDVCSSDLVEAEGLAPEGLPPRPSQKEAAVGGVHRLAEPRHDAVERVSPAGQRARRREERGERSEEHTSELQSLMRISYAVFCLKKKNNNKKVNNKKRHGVRTQKIRDYKASTPNSTDTTTN